MHTSFELVVVAKNIEEFVEYWSSKYSYNIKDSYYLDNVGKRMSYKKRQELFEWKNGRKLSEGKQKSIELNYPIKSYEDEEIECRFMDPNKVGTRAIWNIFWSHCLNPEKFPIYDQHTHRAMRYLKTKKVEEISNNNKLKIETYKAEYVPFILSLGNVDRRKLDKALFAFGKFLKSVDLYC